jgi:uncharacterized membrane protein YhhN
MRKKVNKALTVLFILIAQAIYIAFLFFEDSVPVAKVEYAGIIICLLFSLLLYKNQKDTWLVRIALLFTVISDWFLVIRGQDYFFAMITFTIAQLIYALRLWQNDGSIYRNMTHIFARILFLVILIFGVRIFLEIMKLDFDRLLFLAVIYFSLLVMNVLISFIQIRKNILFPIGMMLFLCCDVLVGLSNIQNYLTISESSFLQGIINCPIDLIWVFYFPSQVLLVLSILTSVLKKDNIKETSD